MHRLLALLALLAAGAPAPPAAPPAASPSPTGLVELEAIVLVVGTGGSEQVRRERAVLSPGRKGLLQVSVSLPGGGAPVVETVTIDLRLRLEGGSEPPAPGEGAAVPTPEAAPLRVAVDSTARAAPSGEVVMRSGGGELSLPGSIWFEPYVSTATGQRVVIHLSARDWVREEAVVPRTGISAAPAPVTYRVWIYRRTPSGLDLIQSPVLGSLVGQTASYTFGFRLDPAGGAQPNESLQADLLAVEIADGVLTGTATLSGLLRGHPVRAEAPFGLRNGEQAFLTLRLPMAEGTADLGFEIAIVAAF